MKIDFFSTNGPAQQPEEQTSVYGAASQLPPVMGQKGSLTEIPIGSPLKKTGGSITAASSDLTEPLLERFKVLMPLCRELMRRRIYGLKKRNAKNEIETEAQRLPEEAFGPDARQLFVSLARAILDGQSDLMAKLWLVDYVETPPGIDEFVHDDRFLGQDLKPRDDNGGIWPTWRDLLRKDYDLDSEVENAVITGALGTGKTLILVVIMLYRLCLATMLINPQKFHGMNRSSRLGFVLLSVTRSTVLDTAFSEALHFMADSSYFVDDCGVDPKRNYADCRVEMKRVLPDGRTCGIVLTAGSRSQHMLGRNVLAVGLDEGNFRLEADPDLTAHRLYEAARSRMENRFRRMPGFLPTLSLIASSSADETSFTEKVIREIADSGKAGTQKVHRFAVYHIRKPGLILSRRWFKVAFGLTNFEPCILQGFYDQNGIPIGSEPHEEAPKGAGVELVPENYFESFRRDPRTALQEFSGISIGGTHRLFSDTIDLERCIELSNGEEVINPLVGQAESLAISRDDSQNIWDYIDVAKFITRNQSQNQPLRHPGNRRYAHVDLAQSSAAGLAICHLVAQKPVAAVNAMGEQFTELRLIVEYDLILRILPGSNHPISIEKIQNLFVKLRNDWGFRFGLITYDMFQSAMTLEMLEAKGFNTARLSIDHDKTGFTAWRTAAQEHRLRFYRHEQLLAEVTRLVDCGRKFDHPPGSGAKDVADAVAGAYLDAIGSDEKLSLGIENSPVIHGISGMASGDQDKLGFDFLGDYLKKNPRPIRTFEV